ncbi:hypothetical protein [Parabacteroides goldsteinii]|uniref:hypothetical protein n=1 Tax=Parabacteroides goldsteinii TaxID=328812 RepID=UPI00333EAB04
MKEASDQMWSVRTLDRNVSTQYYEQRLVYQREQLSLPVTPFLMAMSSFLQQNI